MRGIRAQKKMWSGRGDQNSEKRAKNHLGFLEKNCPLKPSKYKNLELF